MSHNSNITEFGTLCPHRAVGTSGKENSMARKRYQNGRVFLKGKKEEKWVGRYREDVVEVTGTTKLVRRSVILDGLCVSLLQSDSPLRDSRCNGRGAVDRNRFRCRAGVV